jgi:hypothetical protein
MQQVLTLAARYTRLPNDPVLIYDYSDIVVKQALVRPDPQGDRIHNLAREVMVNKWLWNSPSKHFVRIVGVGKIRNNDPSVEIMSHVGTRAIGLPPRLYFEYAALGDLGRLIEYRTTLYVVWR